MSSSTRFCDNCGNELNPDDIFCSNCGMENKIPKNQEQAFGTIQPGSPQNTYSSRETQHDFTSPDDQYLANQSIVDGTKKMLTSPQQGSIEYVAYSNAPSAFPIVILRGFFAALTQYFLLSTDAYFDVLFRENFEQLATQQGTTVEMLRSSSILTVSVLFGIAVIVIWYVSSWLLSVVINGGLHPQSPVKTDRFAAMRRLNGYKSMPIVVYHFLSFILIFVFSPGIYSTINIVILLIASLYSAFILYRALGEQIGYMGSWNIFGSVITAFYFLWFRL